MMTMTCLIGVVVLPSLLPLSPAAAAAAAIGAMLLMAMAEIATPHNSLYLRKCRVPIGPLSNKACWREDAPAAGNPLCQGQCRSAAVVGFAAEVEHVEQIADCRTVHRHVGIVWTGGWVRQIVAAVARKREKTPVAFD